MAKKTVHPFQGLVHVLKHNGSTSSRLTEITGPRFFNLLHKAGWEQAFSGKGKTHIYQRLCERDRGQACGILTVRDLASALENGFPLGSDRWVNLTYRAVFVVNWKKKWFVTLLILDERTWQEIREEET